MAQDFFCAPKNHPTIPITSTFGIIRTTNDNTYETKTVDDTLETTSIDKKSTDTPHDPDSMKVKTFCPADLTRSWSNFGILTKCLDIQLKYQA